MAIILLVLGWSEVKGKFGASINSHEPIEFSLDPVHFSEDGYGNSRWDRF